MKISKWNIFLVFISIVLVIIPFFWLKPGEMDLGGDSSRLYFYDPLSYLKNAGLYDNLPTGLGLSLPNFHLISYVGVLAIVKHFVSSTYLLITLFNGMELVVAFLFIYLIIKEILINIKRYQSNIAGVNLSAILGGLLYVFMPSMTINWDKALITHGQTFINPLVFYLLMKYVFTKDLKYMWVLILTTLVFSPNFSVAGAPSIFSFFPLSLLFLFLYVKFIRKTTIPWKGIFISFTFFLGIHLFNILPQFLNIFEPGSLFSTRIFSKESMLNDGVRYFLGILPLSKVSLRILIIPTLTSLNIFSLLVPLIVAIGFFINKKSRELSLAAIFFLVTLFLLTAKITNIGVLFYSKLFYIPAFSMFQNFLGQWLWVYSFFYSIIFGIALFIISSRLSKTLFRVFAFILMMVLVIQAWQFINGELVNHKLLRSDRYIAIKMDQEYEKFLSFVKNIPDDSKILTLPFSDSYTQLIAGINNGAYFGPSTIAYLAGKNDFAGYQDMGGFPEVFLSLSKNKKYDDINKLLGILNIKYIFHNTDSNIYDKAFPDYPYDYVRHSMPVDQQSYASYVNNLVSSKIYEIGPYKLFQTKQEFYLPHFYVARNIISYENNVNDWQGKNMSFFAGNTLKDPRIAYLNKSNYDKDITYKNIPNIVILKINPTKYVIKVINANEPYLLIFSDIFDKDWRIFLSSKKSEEKTIVASYFNGEIREEKNIGDSLDRRMFETLGYREMKSKHVLANGYANAWFVKPQDVGGQSNYEIVVELIKQRKFYCSMGISVIFLTIFLAWGIKLFIIDKFLIKYKKHV